MPHKPSTNTREFGDICFYTALTAAEQPSPAYDVERWMFIPNTYTEYRYILGTRGTKPLICIGVNPSTAEPDHLDPTLQSVQRIALHNGFESFIMLNVYPQRSTSPKDLDPVCHHELHNENLQAFRYALSLSETPAVWAAWGTIIEIRPYLSDCLRDLVAVSFEYGARWYHCGTFSKKGHPHHPLYLRKDTPLEDFDAEGYLRRLK